MKSEAQDHFVECYSLVNWWVWNICEHVVDMVMNFGTEFEHVKTS